ncbi:PC-esterase domain-containing protein 1A-like [Cyprinodon tularosa]|uniref:PC-esterase domain-containing protein 1A-like n=1 Tax=Cyprinodon tularosa TaxID=77115 RepID=UPI0018E23206|nr:PC-esterase domain-containing protein 1A-like [Cyprinodon tularosa]
MRSLVTTSQARKLLHNKFVVILGGSVQRSMYKDLVVLLQSYQHLTLSQLKSKGEFSFQGDVLVEGGCLGPKTNGTEYKEVRQYVSSHHLLRYYFLTRIYSPYMESILEDFRQGLRPDVLIVNSCVWDLTRYGLESLNEYKENLNRFFSEIKAIVLHSCLVVWVLAMPIGKKIKGGFLVPEVRHLGPTLCYNIIEANFYSSKLADFNGFDVLDLHFYFRHSLQHRMPDGIHWDALAHRRISSLLLRHVAEAWGIKLYEEPRRVSQNQRDGLDHRLLAPPWSCQRAPNSELLQGSWGHQHRQWRAPLDGFRPPPAFPDAPVLAAWPHHVHQRRLQSPAFVGVCRFSAPCPRPGFQRFPPARPLLPHQYRPQSRAERFQMGSQFNTGGRFHPRFQRDFPIERRRWRGMTSRRHPYPHHPPPWVTSRHSSYGW